MTQSNPFTQINDRFDQIESLITEIKTKVDKPQALKLNERLTRKQVSQEYKVSYTTLHKLMKEGVLEFEKIGRKTLFKRSNVDRFFSGKEVIISSSNRSSYAGR